MNKDKFLNLPYIAAFIEWMVSKEQPNSFAHGYTSLKPRQEWNCHSLYNAFENYDWKGVNFDSTSIYLNNLKASLRNALSKGSNARPYCENMLSWGGVLNKGNKAKLDCVQPFDSFEHRLLDAGKRLDPNTFSFTHSIDGLPMSSGFSKIYSLLIDDFVIYDSRVGAALGLLVRKFCEEYELNDIPTGLDFAYAKARPAKGHKGEIRDPSAGNYVFPKLNNNAQRYIENNMRANWLIGAIAKHQNSMFRSHHSPGRCLESALFMIGYKVN